MSADPPWLDELANHIAQMRALRASVHDQVRYILDFAEHKPRRITDAEIMAAGETIRKLIGENTSWWGDSSARAVLEAADKARTA